MNFSKTALAALAALSVSAPAQAASRATGLCWVEYSRGEAPGAFAGAGLQTTKTWRNTVSGIVVRHPKGDVLIDAGWSAQAAEQMAELAPAKQPFARAVLGGMRDRTTAPAALAQAGIDGSRIRQIVVTHAHYDHLAGAADLPGIPIRIAAEEIGYTQAQLAAPDIVAASNIRAVRDRFVPIAFKARPYLGFPSSHDLYGDGSVVVVPLSGHTPGSVGVFVTAGGKRLLAIGDAASVLEAVVLGVPKSAQLRAFTDHDGPAADAQVRALSAFHKAHPKIAIVPAHDRDAFEAVFGANPACVAR